MSSESARASARGCMGKAGGKVCAGPDGSGAQGRAKAGGGW